jgi:DNA-binding response OmpR family regulator
VARILVVDDHRDIVRLVQRELEKEGHEVSTAADGDEALEQMRSTRPQLVVLDVMLPRRNGFEVLRSIRSDPATRETIVILLTAMDHPEEVTFGLELGADCYLTKPFRPGEVTSLVRRFTACLEADPFDEQFPEVGAGSEE